MRPARLCCPQPDCIGLAAALVRSGPARDYLGKRYRPWSIVWRGQGLAAGLYPKRTPGNQVGVAKKRELGEEELARLRAFALETRFKPKLLASNDVDGEQEPLAKKAPALQASFSGLTPGGRRPGEGAG